MKMTFACTALAAALIGIGSVALADDAMMKPAAMPAHMATMLCRAADGSRASDFRHNASSHIALARQGSGMAHAVRRY